MEHFDKDFQVLFLIDSVRYFRKQEKNQTKLWQNNLGGYGSGSQYTKLVRINKMVNLLEKELFQFLKV